jgi:hypothetical protein
MVVNSVWLLYHKASLSINSPMNQDGSTFIQGIGVVPAEDMQTALKLFDDYLQSQQMTILEMWKCELWNSNNFKEDTLEHRQINRAASNALENNKIYYACGISSEAFVATTDDDTTDLKIKTNLHLAKLRVSI